MFHLMTFASSLKNPGKIFNVSIERSEYGFSKKPIVSEWLDMFL